MSDFNWVTTEVSFMVVINIAVYILAVGLSWWALQEFRFDLFLKRPHSGKAKMLMIFLSLGLGHLVASFFLQYLSWSISLNQIFR